MSWFSPQPIFLQNVFSGLRYAVLSLSSYSPPLFHLFLLFWVICNTYPRLISSCSSGSELYALSRHKCCSLLLFPLPVLGLDDDDGLLMTMLSTTFVTSLMSWVLAEEITADSGMPFLSVRMCLFVPSLPLSVGLFPGHRPPKATLWICCLWIAMSS